MYRPRKASVKNPEARKPSTTKTLRKALNIQKATAPVSATPTEYVLKKQNANDP